MSSRRLVDTNLIVRHLTQDHAAHAEVAAKLFAACDRGDLTLVLLPAVLAECVFVLESFYKHPRERISHVLRDLLSANGLEIDDVDLHREALRRYAEGNLHFIDCTLAAAAVRGEMPIATFDAGLKKLEDVQVLID